MEKRKQQQLEEMDQEIKKKRQRNSQTIYCISQSGISGKKRPDGFWTIVVHDSPSRKCSWTQDSSWKEIGTRVLGDIAYISTIVVANLRSNNGPESWEIWCTCLHYWYLPCYVPIHWQDWWHNYWPPFAILHSNRRRIRSRKVWRQKSYHLSMLVFIFLSPSIGTILLFFVIVVLVALKGDFFHRDCTLYCHCLCCDRSVGAGRILPDNQYGGCEWQLWHGRQFS